MRSRTRSVDKLLSSSTINRCDDAVAKQAREGGSESERQQEQTDVDTYSMGHAFTPQFEILTGLRQAVFCDITPLANKLIAKFAAKT